MTDINNSEDILDVRDIIARVEALREEREDWALDAAQDRSMNAARELWGAEFPDELAELDLLEDLLSELAGYGGDEQWEGDWYPVTLIRDSHFEAAMDELLDDIGDLPKDLPSYLTITVDYRALQQDYSSVEFDGVTYWYR